MLIDPALLNECRDLALTVAPELRQAPLYVMGLPDLPMPAPSHNIAFTSRQPIVALCEALKDAGRWEGPGSIICFSHELSPDEALAITIHETAHLVPYEPPEPDCEPSPSEREYSPLLLAINLSKAPEEAPPLPRWFPKHGQEFVRACVHLHSRAWQAGYEIPLPAVCFAGPAYDLSPAWCFKGALGDEPARMRDSNFAEILSQPLPDAFREVWKRDVREWQKNDIATRNQQ